LKSNQYSFQKLINAFISLEKQLQPYHIHDFKYDFQILLSAHNHLVISSIFVQILSEKLATSLIKLSFIAKNELDTYLINSEDFISVSIIFIPLLKKLKYISLINFKDLLFDVQ
jgi:hypothetical protein